ncbi:hypothetical protein KML001_35540 [Klebsiella quasipneumoniae subsp. similipneumoniae]|nr:hypothetical protein KML001_35540 [Klebsiella quasipneumoniae subsp. similipneumoniae]
MSMADMVRSWPNSAPTLTYTVPKHAKSRLHSLTLPTNTQRAGLAPARSVYSTLLRNAAVRGLLGALKICPGLPSS